MVSWLYIVADVNLPWGWTWAGVLDVLTALSTIAAAAFAAVAIRTVVADRRATWELERLREVRLAFERYNPANAGATILPVLTLIPPGVIPKVRKAYSANDVDLWSRLGGVVGDPSEQQQGGLMPDGRTVGDHLRDEVDVAIAERLGRRFDPWRHPWRRTAAHR